MKLEIPLRRRGTRRIDWGERSERAASGCPGDNLLRRVFLLDVLACACGGTRRVIAAIESGPVARKILTHLGLPSVAPALGRARIDQGELFATGPPEDHRQVPPHEDLDQRTAFDAA